MLLRHRWVTGFVGGRPPLGPNTMLNLDRSLAMLDGLGVGTAMTFHILETVSTYGLRPRRDRGEDRGSIAPPAGVTPPDRRYAGRRDERAQFGELTRPGNIRTRDGV